MMPPLYKLQRRGRSENHVINHYEIVWNWVLYVIRLYSTNSLYCHMYVHFVHPLFLLFIRTVCYTPLDELIKYTVPKRRTMQHIHI